MKNSALILGVIIVVLVGIYFISTNRKPAETIPDTTANKSEMIDETVVTPGTEKTDVSEADTKVFSLTGANFAFNEKEIKVKQGDTVTINFESTQGFHDWVIDEFNAATKQVRPGTPTSVTFVADKTGSFEYYCSVGNHRAQGMVGTLIVE